MPGNIAEAQILCYGSTLGVSPEVVATVAVGCTYTRTGAGAYTILFDSVPPGPTVPSASDVIIVVNLIAQDPSLVGAIVTKTGTATAITGFTVATTGAADKAFDWICYRKPQG